MSRPPAREKGAQTSSRNARIIFTLELYQNEQRLSIENMTFSIWDGLNKFSAP